MPQFHEKQENKDDKLTNLPLTSQTKCPPLFLFHECSAWNIKIIKQEPDKQHMMLHDNYSTLSVGLGLSLFALFFLGFVFRSRYDIQARGLEGQVWNHFTISLTIGC